VAHVREEDVPAGFCWAKLKKVDHLAKARRRWEYNIKINLK